MGRSHHHREPLMMGRDDRMNGDEMDEGPMHGYERCGLFLLFGGLWIVFWVFVLGRGGGVGGD
jgi:hypothetical protein